MRLSMALPGGFAGAIALASVSLAQNDDCAGALSILQGSTAFDTTAATDSLPAWTCALGGADLWYRYTATGDFDVRVDLCGSGFDTALEVFDGGDCNSLNVLDCNDDFCGLQSTISFQATMGQDYLLRVGGYNASSGTGTITITPVVPIQNPNNGHYYLLVAEQHDWLSAESEAQNRLWQGAPGHLATFTDQAEVDWVVANIMPGRPWIGLFQNTSSPTYSEPSGGWEWVTGEPVNYTNWSAGEPNDTSASGGAEDYAEMFATGVWNDAELAHSFTNEYLVEWDGDIGSNYCMANPNSTGATGTIRATGSAIIADNDFHLVAEDLPNNAFGFFLTSQTQAFTMNPGGSAGNLCVGGTIGRFQMQIQNSGATGSITIQANLNAFPTPSGMPRAVMSGETWNFTAWHRDTTFLGTATSNFTDGIEVGFL